MSDLANEAADLLSVATASEPRSLNQLVVLATRQVRACSGATAGLWRDGEPVVLVASHPDLPELIEAQLSSGQGPVLEAVADGGPVSCPDTLAETRWPRYADAALRRGVRSSVTLSLRRGAETVTLSLYGARPRTLDSGQLDLAELLISIGHSVVGNAAEYGDARRTATQLRAAAESRELVDQAKGMLMQALGCTADEALRWLRRNSQERNVRVADIARRVIASDGTDGLRPPHR
ncbi:MAG TPA: GAF and ANTAR domain-containing protein [Streptosporangiaceae bacterium]